MRATEFITEIDRRGFLKGLGAVGATAALGSLPSIAKANNITPQEWDSLVWKYKQSWKSNIKLPTPLPAYQQHATITVKVDSSGKVINKTLTQSSGNQDIDSAVLSATGDSIPQELSNRLNLAAGQTTQFFFRSRGIIPDPGTQSQDTKNSTAEPTIKGSVTSIVQKVVNDVLKEDSKIKIQKIEYYVVNGLPKQLDSHNGSTLVVGEISSVQVNGQPGADSFIVSPTGFAAGLFSTFRNLSTPNKILYFKGTQISEFLEKTKQFLSNPEVFYVENNKVTSSQDNKLLDEPVLSEFSIKGLHFGMTKQEVDQIKSRNNMGGGLTGIFSGGEVVNFGSLLGVTSKPNEYSKEFGKEMSFQGMPGYLNYKGGKLVAITLINKSQVINELLEKMLDRFPGGSVQETIWQNRMGNSLPNKEYRWKEVQGASIQGKVRDREVNVGVITFADSRDIQNSISQSQQRQKKDQKDF